MLDCDGDSLIQSPAIRGTMIPTTTSASSTPKVLKLIQFIKSPTGQMQLRGLSPGQQLIRLPDGRLQLLTFPKSMQTSTASTPTASTAATALDAAMTEVLASQAITIGASTTAAGPTLQLIAPQEPHDIQPTVSVACPIKVELSAATTPTTGTMATSLGAAVTQVLAPQDIAIHSPTSDAGPTLQLIALQEPQTLDETQQMQLEVIESKCGKNPTLAMGGYLFHFQNAGYRYNTWLCSSRLSKRCRVRIHTTDYSKNPQFLSQFGSHSHEPDPAKIDKRRMIEKLKKDAANSYEAPKVIIARHVASVSSASQAVLPLKHNLFRMIRDIRTPGKTIPLSIRPTVSVASPTQMELSAITTSNTSTIDPTLGSAVTQVLAPQAVAIHAPTSIAEPTLQLITPQEPQALASAEQMPLEIIESTCGKNPTLAMGGYIFHFQNAGYRYKTWLCSSRLSKRCRVRIHTTDYINNPQFISQFGSHSHEPDPAKIDKRRMIEKLKKDAANSYEAPKVIIARHVASVSSASQAVLPLKHNLFRMIRDIRTPGKTVAQSIQPTVSVASHIEVELLAATTPTISTMSTDLGASITGPTPKPITSQEPQKLSVDRQMQVEIIESKRGKNPTIALGGYVYHFQSAGYRYTTWLCSERRSKKCQVRVHTTDYTRNPQFLSQFGSHFHEPDPAKIDRRKLLLKLRKDATNSFEPPKVIIARNVAGMSSASKAALPPNCDLSRMIRAVRLAKRRANKLSTERSEDNNFPIAI